MHAMLIVTEKELSHYINEDKNEVIKLVDTKRMFNTNKNVNPSGRYKLQTCASIKETKIHEAKVNIEWRDIQQ